MQVKILSEDGYEEALFGLGLSHGVTSGTDFFDDFCPNEIQLVKYVMEQETYFEGEKLQKMIGVARRLTGKGNGHDKFLRQICVWLDITAPRYWWPEMDQYKVATVTQSESTMHTIHKKEFTLEDFESDYGDRFVETIKYLNMVRNLYNKAQDQEHKKKFWRQLIQLLPQSYLQRRIITCNYATLRNIIEQRTGHRLSEWQVFIDAVKTQCQHQELLP